MHICIYCLKVKKLYNINKIFNFFDFAFIVLVSILIMIKTYDILNIEKKLFNQNLLICYLTADWLIAKAELKDLIPVVICGAITRLFLQM